MNPDFDIIIAGAGTAGASVAAALARRAVVPPRRIALIGERIASPPSATSDWDLRVFAISRASQRLLTGIGAWEAIPSSRRPPYERMCVWDAADAPDSAAALRFDCAQLGEPDLGHIVDGAWLQAACLGAARNAGVTLIESRLTAAEAGVMSASVELDGARRLRTSLLIAADGAGSPLRQQAGIAWQVHDYHQHGLVAHLHTERPHQRMAWQRFLPGGPIAWLPLSDGRSSIVWSAPDARAQALLALAPADFEREVAIAGGEVLGPCRLESARAAFPLRLGQAAEYVRPRLALLGDAAHTVHPLAGQGLNLGLGDVAALVEVLARAPTESLGEVGVLRRYERERKAGNRLAAGAYDGLNRLFSNANPLAARARSAGLAAVGRLPPLRDWFARVALGD